MELDELDLRDESRAALILILDLLEHGDTERAIRKLHEILEDNG